MKEFWYVPMIVHEFTHAWKGKYSIMGDENWDLVSLERS